MTNKFVRIIVVFAVAAIAVLTTATFVSHAARPVPQVNQSSTTMWAPLSGTTSSIGGGLLVAGACATGTVTVTSAVAGQPVAVSASDGTNMAAVGAYIHGDVTSSNTVTVSVCAIISITPASKTYNVRVLP